MKASDMQEVQDLLSEIKQYNEILAYYDRDSVSFDVNVGYNATGDDIHMPHKQVYHRFLNQSKEAVTEFVITEIRDARRRVANAIEALGLELDDE